MDKRASNHHCVGFPTTWWSSLKDDVSSLWAESTFLFPLSVLLSMELSLHWLWLDLFPCTDAAALIFSYATGQERRVRADYLQGCISPALARKETRHVSKILRKQFSGRLRDLPLFQLSFCGQGVFLHHLFWVAEESRLPGGWKAEKGIQKVVRMIAHEGWIYWLRALPLLSLDAVDGALHQECCWRIQEETCTQEWYESLHKTFTAYRQFIWNFTNAVKEIPSPQLQSVDLNGPLVTLTDPFMETVCL